MLDINENILKAISILIDKKISMLQFDKTIIAQVTAIEEKQCKVKYMDNEFYATIGNPNMIIHKGDFVFITILNNDLSSEKVIIGIR